MTDAEIARRWRRLRGLTQAEAAEVFGLSRSQWWRYEKGVKGGRIPRARRAVLVDQLLERLLEGE